MRKSSFKEPKVVLCFNGAGTLIGMFASLQIAADLTERNLQAISFNCTGKYKSTGGLNFRHLDKNVIVETEDLGNLKVKDYDKLCGEQRTYHSTREMKKKRESFKKKKER